jgi:hypothetical protein
VTAARRRRLILGALGTVAALAVLFGLFLAFGIDVVARRGIQKVIKQALGAPAEIQKVRLRLSGKAEITGARIGNPGGYQEAKALDIASLDAFLDTDTLSREVLVIHDMLVIRPDFTVEFANGTSNLAVLVQRLIDAIPEDAPRFKIERLRVREAVVRIGKTVLHLPDLELRNFGDAPGTASTANLLLALFLQILAGGAMEQEEAAFPKSFAGEVKRSAAAIEKVRSR